MIPSRSGGKTEMSPAADAAGDISGIIETVGAEIGIIRPEIP